MSSDNDHNRGSEWGKWDLHIHTPLSIVQGYGGKVNFGKFIDALEKLPSDIKVIGITDYYFIDGYEKVIKEKIKNNRLKNIEKIFSILEFRIDTFGGTDTEFSKVNLHILFNIDESEIDAEIKKVKEEFIGQIPLTKLKEHETFRLSTGNLTKYSGDNKLQTGFSNLIPSTDKVFELLRTNTWESKTLLFAGYTEWDSLDKNKQSKPHKKDIFSKVHAFLSAGNDFNKKNKILKYFGNKPLLHSLDIHDFEKLGDKYSCKTWIKAKPTFEGLRQILHEPETRVKIQEQKPDKKSPYFIINKVKFTDKENNNFGEQEIYFNPNLNAIIGGKSTGKSLLLYLIANNIDPKQVETTFTRLGMKFYDKVDFEVHWKDGKVSKLDEETSSSERKVTYLPQLYLNHLAEKDSKDDLNQLIEEILLQKEKFKIFHTEKKEKIAEISSQLHQYIDNLINCYHIGISTKKEIQELRNKEAIEKEIKKIEGEKIKLKKSSNLSEEEYYRLKKLQDKKERFASEIENLEEKKSLISEIKEAIKDANQYDKISMLFDKYSNSHDDIKSKVGKIETKINNFIDKVLREYFPDKELEEKLSKERKKLKNIEKELKPFLKKIEKEKELKCVFETLKCEKQRLAQRVKLDKNLGKTKEKYKTIKKQVSNGLKKRKNLYDSIVQKVNSGSRKNNEDISLEAQVLIEREKFPLWNQINNNKISQNDTWYEGIFPKNTQEVNINKILELFNKLPSNFQEKLVIQKIELPLKKDFSSEDVYRGLVKDSFNIDYTLTYKNDKLLRMSPGKKATVLLLLFLKKNSSQYPILIDQPEDNLDNRTIYEQISKFISEKKTERQIIIVSHNPNLVVTADSENVIVANQDGQDRGRENAKYRFEFINGAIENTYRDEKREGILLKSGIKEHICDILEGGEEAFLKRENKYNFQSQL